MALEIERKFLLKSDAWREGAQGTLYRQGYLCTDKERTVRVRRAGTRGFITLKGISRGASREEFEYEIPAADADAMLKSLCLHPLVEKTRYCVEYRGFTWEIDEFFGQNEGLVIAEIELESEEQPFDLPAWAGEEVTGDARYFNASLSQHPFREWSS